MRSNDDALKTLIAQQAADWFVANREELSIWDREEFAAWLQASPAHVEEYLELAAIARDLRAASPREMSVDALLARVRAAGEEPMPPAWQKTPVIGDLPARRPRYAMALATFAVIGLGVLAMWNLRSSQRATMRNAATTLRFETRHGEQQSHRLIDGTVLHLNTDSAVSVSYSTSERIVVLSAGEAEFEVVHDRMRPFRVFAGAAEAVDIGTQFNVRLGSDSTVITVLEGRLAVGPSSMLHNGTGSRQAALAKFVELSGDQQISVTPGMWPAAPIAVDAHRNASWLQRQIAFDHEPLSRVATEFNRYAAKPIDIVTPALRDVQISGVFAIDDTAAFIAFLRSLDGVHVEVTATRVRVTRD